MSGTEAGAVPDEPTVLALAALCAEVIGVLAVSPDDSFLDVGGDSVSAARLAVLAEERWGVEVDIFAVVAADTVREIHDDIVARGRQRQAG